MKKWYCNTKTQEVDSYNESGDLTDFNRGEFLAYGDYLVTGYKTKEDALLGLKTWLPCDTCNGTALTTKNNPLICIRCNKPLKEVSK